MIKNQVDTALHFIEKYDCKDELKWDEWVMCGYRFDYYNKELGDANLYAAILSHDKQRIQRPHFNRIELFPVITYKKGDLFCLVYNKAELLTALLETF